MAYKNDNLPLRSNSEIEKEMQKLHCPFTWSMNDITKEDDVMEYHLNDDEELFPLLQLMRRIMTVYVDTKSKHKSGGVWEGLEKCDEIMLALKENNHPEISIDVVHYVLQSTKCFVFKHLNLPRKMKKIFSEINKLWRMDRRERSTLIACRGICWSKYHRIGSSEAEKFIREAIGENPSCELWHFVLGKNLRRKRRDATIAAKPGREEIGSFEKAYGMSANPVFGIFLAQMYREMWKKKEAKSIYDKIFEQRPAETTILLRLALGFVRLKSYTKAKECLDRVEAVSPEHGMYLHYRGIYYFSQKNYQAAIFLKEATKDNNIPAEKQYLDCAVILDKSFNIIQYLHDMVNKYSHMPEEQIQPLLLDLAVACWLKSRDVPNKRYFTMALKYFNMAVEMNPEAKCLTNYFSSQATPIAEKNMYQLLNRNILPIVYKNITKFEISCIAEAEELQIFCDQYFAKNFARSLNSFAKFNLRNLRTK